MTFSGNFGINYPRDHVKVAKLPSLRSCNFVNFNMTLGQLIPNCPLSHTITITNRMASNPNVSSSGPSYPVICPAFQKYNIFVFSIT